MDGNREVADGDGVGGVVLVGGEVGRLDWRACPLRGRGLRLILADELRRRPSMSVAELVAALDEQGFRVAGRASKVISDALRWEIAAGRVERLARGVYGFVADSRSHRRRSARFASFCRHWIVAVRRGHIPTPTPGDKRSTSWTSTPGPDTPPWFAIGWIWAT